jgi:hypothetical protein
LICFFGDVHFTDQREYLYEAGNEFLSFYKNLSQNNSQNIAVFLGDLVETFINSGRVFEQLHLLLEYSKFKHIYVLVGNHDLRKSKGREHLAFEFIRNMQNVTILEKPFEEITIEGYSCLSLPHYNHIEGLPPMYDHYNSIPKEFTSKTYDFVLGHLTDNTINAFGKVADLSAIKTKKLILGHIHTRSNSSYIGSIYPLNPLQSDETRAIWCLDKYDWSEISLPKMLGYYEVEFPESLPAVDHKISSWTVYNCYDVSLLKQKYGNIHIRQVNSKPKNLNKSVLKKEHFRLSFSDSQSSKPIDLLNELIKSSSTSYDRGAVSILKKLLSSPA